MKSENSDVKNGTVALVCDVADDDCKLISMIEDFEEIKKDNDRLSTIIVKLRMNKELLNVVEKLLSLDKAKLESLSRLLDTFV